MKSRFCRIAVFVALLPIVVLRSGEALSHAPAAAESDPAANRLIFQTSQPWTPRTNINAGTVLVYGIDETTAARVRSWREHGYHVDVMTGVAWGRYAPYLRGDFDGKEHWNETQQEKSGALILHSGREVPYIAPSLSYGLYLAQGVKAALDSGAEAVYLEEPEFWARAGWSDSFKHEWREFYHEPWQAPDSSPDAQYRASKLKYFLYRRALAQVFAAVKEYGAAHQRVIPCYVATHSLINYAQWQIVSPESSLLDVGADGYIAQVWTGTARVPNFYRGIRAERTFETAFLEYGALQNIARSSGKPIWYLNDPIEDNPNHSWTDYRRNWENTLIASLLQPLVARYEVLPWPERIFGEQSLYPAEEPSQSQPDPHRTLIPPQYETELQTTFHALGDMQQPRSVVHWENAGTQGVGVLVSDTLMFQRADPQPSDPQLSQFYGIAMPLLMRGMPVEPVQIESASSRDAAGFLNPCKVLFLTYEGQKPPSPAFHSTLAAWVRSGGALVVLDDDKDPYNRVTGWWNSGQNHYATPREDLFAKLGLAPDSAGLHRIGKGIVLFEPRSPVSLAHSAEGADALLHLFRDAANAVHLPVKETNTLVLRRGPYVIAAGIDRDESASVASAGELTPYLIHGDLIDLFDANLSETKEVTVKPGTRALLLDVDAFQSSAPRVLAASAKITGERGTGKTLLFCAEGIADSPAVVRVLTSRKPSQVVIDGNPLPPDQYQQSGRTLLLHFTNAAKPRQIEMDF